MSHAYLSKDCVSAKANLDNNNGLINPREHVQNFIRILELVKKKSDVRCKIPPIIFHGYAQLWYHNLKHNSILDHHDLCVKLMSYFSTSMLAKKSMNRLFTIIQREDESSRKYLYILNEEMLNVKDLLELIFF